MLETILAVALLGQLGMNVELGEAALDPLPAVVKPVSTTVAGKKEPTSEQRLEVEAKRAAAKAAREAAKAYRRELVKQKAQARSYQRQYRMSQPRSPTYAQRYYAQAYAQHASRLGYQRSRPNCQ